MTGYKKVLLSDLVEELGEEKAKQILSEFSCPLNNDVESFLKNSAIPFSSQGLASTHLIFTSYKGKPTFIGYFTLALKNFKIKRAVLSKTQRKRYGKFGTYSNDDHSYTVPAPLIAQLSKNFYNNRNSLITGAELLKIACDTVREYQITMSGKIVYLECEDKTELIEFYEQNGFFNFGKRQLDRDEDIPGTYLIQMLKYL